MPETKPEPGQKIHTARYDHDDYAGRYRTIEAVEFFDPVRKVWTVWDTFGFAYGIFWDAGANEWKEEILDNHDKHSLRRHIRQVSGDEA